MALRLHNLFNDGADHLRARVIAIYAILAALNLGSWVWATIAFRHYPVLLGTAFLAYSFGLRHAVDADHIAAIDNVTRKLMQDGKRPIAVGFLFSLGHSTIVIFGSAAIAATALALQHRVDSIKNVGAVIGTLVSAFFLLAIAIVNLIVLRSIYRAFVRVRRGEPYVDEDFDLLLASRGFLARLFRPMFRMITRSWHMYPLGLLFGMGFDTATEIGVLGISASEASKGLPFWSILVFPMLFAAGMSLIDTTDNLLMLGAYGWAFIKPIRKLYYNMTITFLSVIVAFAVGGIEALGLLAGRFHLSGFFWDEIRKLNENFGTVGYFIVALFALSWLVSIAIYKWYGFEDQLPAQAPQNPAPADLRGNAEVTPADSTVPSCTSIGNLVGNSRPQEAALHSGFSHISSAAIAANFMVTSYGYIFFLRSIHQSDGTESPTPKKSAH